MNVNGKKVPVENNPGMGKGRIEENGGGTGSKYDVFEIL
jgi:hypothetical protein